jgi:hypothetical protein
MQNLQQSGELHGDVRAAQAAMHGHLPAGVRQIVAASTLSRRFRCGRIIVTY